MINLNEISFYKDFDKVLRDDAKIEIVVGDTDYDTESKDPIGKDGRVVFTKPVDWNEFVGSRLAKIRDNKTADYFLVSLGKYPHTIEYKDLKSDKILLGSYDFRREGYEYKFLKEIGFSVYPDPERLLDELLIRCPSEANRKKLLEEILELFALDIFMGQYDRYWYNVMLQFDKEKNINLAPIFDYEASFDESVLSKDTVFYYNPFWKFDSEDDCRRFIDKFPQFYNILKSYLDVDLLSEVRIALYDNGYNVDEINLCSYSEYENRRKELLVKILK